MEPNIIRGYYHRLINRLKVVNPLIQVLSGPRQVGKTTLVRQVLEDGQIAGIYITADQLSVGHEAWLESQWERALALAAGETRPFCLIVDEVQKIPQWSELVKRLWDARKTTQPGINLLLLGSSRLLLQDGLTESLMGRFETLYLGHWDFDEMNRAFGLSLDEYIYFGGYPGGAHLLKEPERWHAFIQDAIVETSISRDVLQLTRIDKPALLRNLFDVGCSYSSRELSYTKILGQLDGAGNTTTLAHYLKLLGSAGLLSGLEKFERNTIRKRSSSPKLQVHNNALLLNADFRAFEAVRQDHALWGKFTESAVGAHLINKSLENRFSLHYWREGPHEVDFVISKGDSIAAIEVKSGGLKELAGLEKFKQKFPQAKLLLVGNRGIPLEEFLRTNPADFLR